MWLRVQQVMKNNNTTRGLGPPFLTEPYYNPLWLDFLQRGTVPLLLHWF